MSRLFLCARTRKNLCQLLFRRGLGDGVSGHFPPVNIAENDDAYVIQARVPGLAKDDIAIELEGRKLTISGEHKRVEAEYAREERSAWPDRTGRLSATKNPPMATPCCIQWATTRSTSFVRSDAT